MNRQQLTLNDSSALLTSPPPFMTSSTLPFPSPGSLVTTPSNVWVSRQGDHHHPPHEIYTNQGYVDVSCPPDTQPTLTELVRLGITDDQDQEYMPPETWDATHRQTDTHHYIDHDLMSAPEPTGPVFQDALTYLAEDDNTFLKLSRDVPELRLLDMLTDYIYPQTYQTQPSQKLHEISMTSQPTPPKDAYLKSVITHMPQPTLRDAIQPAQPAATPTDNHIVSYQPAFPTSSFPSCSVGPPSYHREQQDGNKLTPKPGILTPASLQTKPMMGRRGLFRGGQNRSCQMVAVHQSTPPSRHHPGKQQGSTQQCHKRMLTPQEEYMNTMGEARSVANEDGQEIDVMGGSVGVVPNTNAADHRFSLQTLLGFSSQQVRENARQLENSRMKGNTRECLQKSYIPLMGVQLPMKHSTAGHPRGNACRPRSLTTPNHSRPLTTTPAPSCAHYKTDTKRKYIKRMSKEEQIEKGNTLWQFLMRLLVSRTDIVAWTGNDLEFRIVEKEAVARKWGALKSRDKMNFDKFSRALRYYYNKRILIHNPQCRLTYCFMRNPRDPVFSEMLHTAMQTIPVNVHVCHALCADAAHPHETQYEKRKVRRKTVMVGDEGGVHDTLQETLTT